ncbi:MAG: DUF4159 domain-containing protein [Flavobacteriaceae bacterium]
MSRFSIFVAIFSILFNVPTHGQELAILKYSGGGDWYSNPTALKNLIEFCNEEIKTSIALKPDVVTASDNAILDYPLVHMTGHGNVIFSPDDIENLRQYLLGGGFLHIDDNYGMKPFILPQIKALFPNKELREIPANHPLFNIHFKFPNGLPKIHEHDGLPPKALGIFENNKLILLYTYESDLGDGWEDPEIHNDSPEVRLKALQMGANIVKYAFEF